MAYLQHTSWKERPGAVVAVIGIHAVIGYALVTGLSFNGLIEDIPNVEGILIPDVPLDPPPPDPADEAKTEIVPDRTPVAPLPPLDLSERRPPIDTTDIILPPLDLPRVIPTASPSVDVGPKRPAFDPVRARPHNNPAAWVTTADYRSSWINREMTGVARFRLEIGAGGRVENCTITGSSGHPELDRATCELVTRRARFDAAKDGAGEKTRGSYSSAVSWELPR